jgi:hypothetical protein
MPRKADITVILVDESKEVGAKRLAGEIQRESSIPWVARIERVAMDNKDEEDEHTARAVY